MNKIISKKQRFLILKKNSKQKSNSWYRWAWIYRPASFVTYRKRRFKVIGYDIDKKKIELLNNKKLFNENKT